MPARGGRLALAKRRAWWESPYFAWACIFAAAIPLLWPALPPLVDLPGHVGRYHVALSITGSPTLQRDWIYHWAAIGNLGVDLLVMPLAPLIGLEPAVKAIVIVIPMLFVAGLIRVSRAADGTLSPLLPLAFPLAYGFPFQLGFVNFMLAAALALHALASWITLGRRGRLAWRAVLFVPLSCALWLTHSFGWGLFGLLAFTAEFVRLRPREPWPRALFLAGLHCVPLALPMLAMLGGAGGSDHGFAYDWRAKAAWVASLLRERWKFYDVGCAIVLVLVLWTALRKRRLFRFEPLLGALALAGFAIYLALPRLLLGGAYVDMRMLGIAVALAIAAIRLQPGAERFAARCAAGAIGFFALRLATSTIALALFAQGQQQALAALPHIPRGAGVLVLVNEPCSTRWHSDRFAHLDGLALARRDAFVNGQWALGGQQLIVPRHRRAAPYLADPSQLVYPATCEYRTTDFGTAVRDFDRGTFGYVWTLGFPGRPRLSADTPLAWNNNVSALYRVEPRLSATVGTH
jgi:hypothetical protein